MGSKVKKNYFDFYYDRDVAAMGLKQASRDWNDHSYSNITASTRTSIQDKELYLLRRFFTPLTCLIKASDSQ